jgi:hypothetical protein
MQDEVAGNLTQKVSPEKDSSRQSELLAGDSQLTIHGQRGESDIDPVEEGNDIEQEEKRQEPDPEFPYRCCLDRVRNDACGVRHLCVFPMELANLSAA